MESLLKVRNINKEIKIKGKKKKLLDDVTFDIKAGEFVAIVGVSGAGKTTLLNVLSGYDNYSSGEIYLDNQDIAHNKGYYLDKISYVPQKEILHDHLALKKSLMYSAILRNPKKNKKDIEKNVDNTLGILELKGKENTLIKNLSGGERKRASIASELLSKPNILFLDEPTSGLDSNIEKKLMKTLKDITLRGQTILITAHTVSNLYLCDKIIFMSDGGKICFIGTYEESLKYFQVEEFVDIYEKLKNSEEAEKYQQKYKKIKWDKINKVSVKKVRKERISFFKEIYILAKRYVEIILNNKFFSFLLFAQAIIMGLAVIVVVSQDWFKIYDKAKILLFAFSCAAMWLGLFNSVQEIVKERNIIKLEYFNNMRLSAYIISKLIVFAVISLIQAILFLSIINLKVEFPDHGLLFNSAFLEYTLEFFLVSFSSSMLGMFISSIVKTTEITLIITPIYMMFQLLFSGVLVELSGLGEKISNVIIGRYAIEIFGTTTNLIDVLHNTMFGGVISSNVTTQLFIKEAEQYYMYTNTHMYNVFGILIISILIFIILSIVAIKYNIRKKN